MVEFTVFSDNLIEKEEYKENLEKYISEKLKTRDYKIIETEYGVIPMSDEPHEELSGSKTIRIGTSGGFVKPSTGYSFKRTQEKLQKLVENLEDSRAFSIQHSAFSTWKLFLDSVLLNVLETKKHPAAGVFTNLFQKNKTSKVLEFLDEKTSVKEDLRIMKTVPLSAFSKAAMQEIFKKSK